MLTRPDNSDFSRFSEGMAKKNGLTRTGHGTAEHTRFSEGYRKVLLITILYGITAISYQKLIYIYHAFDRYVTFLSVFSNISDHKFVQFKYDK